MPTHLNPTTYIFDIFHNLSHLEVTFGSRHRGENYCREGFGMKISDVNALSNSIRTTNRLITLALPCNLIDIEIIKILLRGLLINTSIACLDLSYNCLDEDCALKIAGFILRSRSIVELNLSENQVCL
jgi:hypothetical protein